jgi:hypothetical protein
VREEPKASTPEFVYWVLYKPIFHKAQKHQKAFIVIFRNDKYESAQKLNFIIVIMENFRYPESSKTTRKSFRTL